MTRARSGPSWWPALSVARRHAASSGACSVGTQHVLLALLGTDGDASAVLARSGVDQAGVLAALQGITGVGARRDQVAVERVAVSPRVGALIRRASHGEPGEIPNLAVLGELLDDGGEPSLVQLVLNALGARRRALAAYRSVSPITPVQIGHADGDLTPA